MEDIQYRGRTYPDSVHAEDVALFVSPGDVEDAAYYAGKWRIDTMAHVGCDGVSGWAVVLIACAAQDVCIDRLGTVRRRRTQAHQLASRAGICIVCADIL